MELALDLDHLAPLLADHDVALVVAFGSRVRGDDHAGSDLDLGVLSTGGERLGYRRAADLQAVLTEWARVPADVVDLAAADALVRFEVVRHGKVLHEAVEGAWTGFVARTLIDHDDVAPFVQACIRGVGESGTRRGPQVTAVVLARKLAEIRSRVARVRELLPGELAAFLANRTEAEALILNLYLALQAASDTAMHVVADRGLGVPADARGAFALLGGAGVVEDALARKLAAAVGMRNRIAHQYGTLDLSLVNAAARDELGDLDAFAAALAEAYSLGGEGDGAW